jgi:hypothetical protein
MAAGVLRFVLAGMRAIRNAQALLGLSMRGRGEVSSEKWAVSAPAAVAEEQRREL